MSILRKAMCSAGRHSGQWSLPGRRCEIVRICDSCGSREEQARHVWGRFDHVNAGQCDQVRRCDRCGAAQSRSLHQWGPWLYADDEIVTAQVHTCRRCHHTERTGRFSRI
jgi:hypothetical protein